jgi:hypothetical protein
MIAPDCILTAEDVLELAKLDGYAAFVSADDVGLELEIWIERTTARLQGGVQ